MTKTVNAFWAALQDYCDNLRKKGLPIILKSSLKDKYVTSCNDAYKRYKENYMKPGVENLDRHKNAAILVMEGELLGIITTDKESADELFIGQEKILLVTAFRYLVRELNNVIEKTTRFEKVEDFRLPAAFSCNTNYLDILCRILSREKREVFSKHPDTLLTAEMDWAERFFLLEYISIHRIFGEKKAQEVYSVLENLAKNSKCNN